jgi:UDP-3-O-[3-hydroxymyristoyl] glucosamine N-acyltransferase LpxD
MIEPRRLKTPSELWPRGFESLVADLESAGLRPHITKSSSSEDFKTILLPCSASAPTPSSYGYLEVRTKTGEGEWGLLFADPACKDLPPAKFIVTLESPACAVDLILSKATPAQWSGASAPIPQNVKAEAHVVVGPDTQIGAGTILESGVRIGARVRIGKNCFVGANSRIADDTVIGNDCHFSASVALGGPGFGLLKYPGEKHQRQRVHAGRLVIGDNVRLGSFVAIDRGVLEDTVIGSHSLIDNVVQIGHNCKVGEGSILCGMVGLAGSTTLGQNVVLAGQVGIGGHVSLGDGVVAGGQCGITSDIPAGLAVTGTPWRPMIEESKIRVLIGKLPEIYKSLRKLEEKL